MTPTELRSALLAGIARNGEDGDLVWTFVSPGPHGLPVRPRLLSETQRGERVYGLNGRQARKLIGLIDESS